MSLTNFPNGVTSYGVPVLGGDPAGRFYGWWGKSYFVDYDSGSNGNSGTEPSQSWKTLTYALTRATHNDVIYIRPRGLATPASDTDPTATVADTTSNFSTGTSQYALSIIGAGPALNPSGIWMNLLQGNASAAATVPVLTIGGAYTCIENLGFSKGAATTSEVTIGAFGFGSAIHNCLFRVFTGTSSATGALTLNDAWDCTISGSLFDRCKVGLVSTAPTASVRGTRVLNNEFRGTTAGRIVDVNITASGTNVDMCTIHGNVFNGPIPTGGAPNVYINTTASIGVSVISGNWFNIADLNPASDIVLGASWLDIGNYDSTNAHIA